MRSRFVRLIAAALAVAAAAATAAPTYSDDPNDPRNPQLPPVIIGIYQSCCTEFTPKIFEPTFEALEHYFAPRRVEIKQENRPSLESDIKNQKVDFFISTAGFFAQMLFEHGALQLANFMPSYAADPNHTTGSTFIVLEKSPYRNVEELYHSHAAIADMDGYAAHWLALGEIARLGFDPWRFFSSRSYTGTVRGAVEAVRSGRADVAIAPACTIEHLQQLGVAEGLKVIGEKPGNGLDCMVSTDTYPHWIFSSTGKARSEDVRHALVSLLTDHDRLSNHWGVVSDLKPLNTLMRTLMVGQFEYLRDDSFIGLLRRTWGIWVPFLILMFLLVVHVVLTREEVRIKTRELVENIEARERAEKRAASYHKQIRAMERSGIISQMGSMIAHELKVPLAVQLNAVRGLRRRLERGMADPETVGMVLDKIEEQAQRSAEIVNRVRGYAAGSHKPERVPVSVNDIVHKTVDTLLMSGRLRAKPTVLSEESPSPVILADSFELSIAIFNLVANASDAVREVKEPEIRILVNSDGRSAWIHVEDNGPEISDERLAHLKDPLQTTKSDGMGLGLGIASRIIEAHRGRIFFSKLTPCGLKASVMIPLYKAIQTGQSIESIKDSQP